MLLAIQAAQQGTAFVSPNPLVGCVIVDAEHRFHPAGFPHGPHPKAFAAQGTKTITDEVAVMVDTWQPLQVDPYFQKVEVESYWKSWMAKK